MLEVTATVAEEAHSVIGGIRDDGQMRLRRLDGYPVNIEPRGHLLIIRNDDVPGVIGDVGTNLGSAGINIAEFHQARDLEAGEALAVLSLDEAPEPGVLERIRSLPAVRHARVVALDS